MRAVALAVATLALLACAAGVAPAAERWAWPVRGEVLNHYRNGSDPYAPGQHRGIDVGAPTGTAVSAAAAGSVTYAGSAGSSGLTVSMRTADGRFDLSYLHLSALAVGKGDQIAAGDRVGAVGVSGTRSDPRPHLHFGVRDAAKQHGYLDPLTFLSPPGAPPLPEPPRPVPVPVLAPTRPAPAPVPAPRPVGVPAPRPRSAPGSAPARRPSPARRPLPARRPSPARRPLPAPRPSPARRPLPARRPVPLPSATPRPIRRPLGRPLSARQPALSAPARSSPAPSGEPARAGGRSPMRAPAHGGRLASLGQSSAPPASPAAVAPPAPARDVAARAGGPDLGWLLACLGVGLATLFLAWPQVTRSARAVARAAVEACRRPLFGPR